MWSMKSAAALAVLLWLFTLIYLASQLFAVQGKGSALDDRSYAMLEESLRSLSELRKQNENLKQLIEAERREHQYKPVEKVEKRQPEKTVVEVPVISHADLYSMEHEIARRHVQSNVWEIYYYLHKRFKEDEDSKSKFGNHTENQLLSLLAASYNLSMVDGADKWRLEALKSLSRTIQNKIKEVQNPTDCSKARGLICNLDKECGFGCQLHHIAYCLMTSFSTNRTMIFSDNGKRWRYSNRGWEGGFLPITKCKQDELLSGEKPQAFSVTSDSRVVQLGIIDGIVNKPEFLPLAIPKAYANQLLKLHSDPPAYFAGQFIWYLMRNNEEMAEVVEAAAKHVPFGKDGPVVGLQIRRTDKIGTEAAFHSVDEYMEWTEIYFQIRDRIEGKQLPRRVFIASDDPTVIPEAKKKYPQYEVFGDTSVADTAQLSRRYTDASLKGVVTDINLLSYCDYLVCTFSSQVCRMGFELMQVEHGDAGKLFHSLDDLYYYGGQHPHEQVAIESHEPETVNEIELRVGDVIGIAGNHWDGFSKGNNRRTGKIGLYPSYKAVERWRIVDVPTLN